MHNGNVSRSSSRQPKQDSACRVGRRRIGGRRSMASSGVCGPASREQTYGSDVLPEVPATGVFRRGAVRGGLAKILTALAEDLRNRGGMDLSEGFIDSTGLYRHPSAKSFEMSYNLERDQGRASGVAGGLPLGPASSCSPWRRDKGGGRSQTSTVPPHLILTTHAPPRGRHTLLQSSLSLAFAFRILRRQPT